MVMMCNECFKCFVIPLLYIFLQKFLKRVLFAQCSMTDCLKKPTKTNPPPQQNQNQPPKTNEPTPKS